MRDNDQQRHEHQERAGRQERGQRQREERLPPGPSRELGAAAGGTPTAIDGAMLARSGIAGTTSRLPGQAAVERAIGVTLDHLPVHQDAAAHDVSDALNARGFAHQGRVVLGRDATMNTVAEETVHALQQRSGGTATSARGLVAPHASAEVEAQTMAQGVTQGTRVGMPSVGLAQDSVAMDSKTDAAKQRMGESIVGSMALANRGDSPINYGGQSGQGGQLQGKLNPTYWGHAGDYHFTLLSGKSASKAIESIFPATKEQGSTELECHTMMQAIELRAIKAVIGDDRFDNQFGKTGKNNQNLAIKIGDPGVSILKSMLQRVAYKSPKQLQQGDWVYFENHPSYLDKHPNGAWQGENAIYEGLRPGDNEPTFSGFGASKKSEDEMKTELLKAYNTPRSTEDTAIAAMPPTAELAWLKANADFQDGPFFQLKAELFAGLQDDEEEMYALIEGNIPSNYEYGLAGNTLYVEFLPYEDFPEKISMKDVPGLTRCDRLNINKVMTLGEKAPGTKPVRAGGSRRGASRPGSGANRSRQPRGTSPTGPRGTTRQPTVPGAG